jgi:murein DD-endopeptidase MepM/ murein hydrolase activator NlpD
MNGSARHGALRALAVLLALVLSGCLGAGQSRWAGQMIRPDPPPVPARKPTPPALGPGLVRAASVQTRALTRSVTRAQVTTASLAPARTAAAKRPRAGPAAEPAAEPAAGPASRTVAYRIRPGDTMYGVSRRMAGPLRSILDANDLEPPYVLRVGRTLRVPNPRRHVVRAGDTVYGVARRYGLPVTQLVRLNAIKAPYTIAPGQDLTLPVAARAAATQTAARAGTSPASPRSSARSARPGAAKRGPRAIPQPPPRASGKFFWPVRGRLITRYGPKKNGLHNDGINIAAPRGAPVHAAENGVVAYLGNELRGFGNLILIKHAGGWVTAYAHNADFLVRRGDTVKRGQVIARIGSSGNVATPQLHFEIRKGTRSVDPTRFLGAQRAAAD